MASSRPSSKKSETGEAATPLKPCFLSLKFASKRFDSLGRDGFVHAKNNENGPQPGGIWFSGREGETALEATE